MDWLQRMMFHLLEGDPNQGGGGGGNEETPKDPPAGVTKEDFDSLREQNQKLIDRINALEKKGPGGEDDPDLRTKAIQKREDEERSRADLTKVEAALRFNMGSEKFLEDHKDILPEEIKDIFEVANKENYDSAVEKASAIKANILQSYFSVQDNLDLLTEGQKSQIDSFLKLTKTGREQKAAEIYSNVFEPTLSMVKKIRKAEEVGKSRTTGSKSENAYKERLMKLSRETHLRKGQK